MILSLQVSLFRFLIVIYCDIVSNSHDELWNIRIFRFLQTKNSPNNLFDHNLITGKTLVSLESPWTMPTLVACRAVFDWIHINLMYNCVKVISSSRRRHLIELKVKSESWKTQSASVPCIQLFVLGRKIEWRMATRTRLLSLLFSSKI